MKTLRTIMKILSVLLCLLCLSLSVAADRTPDRDDDITTILLQLERSKFSAHQQKDTASLNALFDDGLMCVDQNGVLLTKADLLAALHNSRQAVDKIAPESMIVKVFATVAIVIGIYDETGLQDGHAFHQRCRFIDTWTWKRGKCVCISATATSAIS